ncbi:hypothetical protein BKA82DRAFT_35645, partial [Pisolithus tinctorius]
MSASHAPHLSQLVCTATPDPIEVEKAALLVAEARCFPEDHEGMEEEKTVVLMPLVEHRKELGVMVRVDTLDVPILAEVDNVYEQWTVEEAEVHVRAKQDVQMGEENMQEIGDKGTAIKMSHVEVPQLVCK